MTKLFFDVETTTKNKGHPFDPDNFMVSYSTLVDQSDPDFRYYLDADFASAIDNCVGNATDLVGFNIKFDLHWLANRFPNVLFQHAKIWDCQLAEFIYSGQESHYASLDETLEKYGLPVKKDMVAEYWAAGVSTESIPLSILREYNNWDVQVTKMLFDVQQNLLSDRQKRLVYLAGEDLKTLQSAEFAGVRFDTQKAVEKLDVLKADIEVLNNRIYQHLPTGIPKGGFNIDSGDHLSALLYGGTIDFDWYTEAPAVYKSGARTGQEYNKRSWHVASVQFPSKFKPISGSEVSKTREKVGLITRFYQTDAPTLQQLKTRKNEDRLLLEDIRARSEKAKVSEMIISIMTKMENMNWQDSMIHGQFNQNNVITGRLSSSGPNMQNTPSEVDELLVSRYND